MLFRISSNSRTRTSTRETKRQRALSCLAFAAKRYALYTLDHIGRPILCGSPDKRRRSEHGLGHLLLPTDPKLGTGPALDQWWKHTICTELGIPNEEPEWFADEAIGRLTVTSQHEERAFRSYNKARSYEQRVRPWNFLNLAHPTRLERDRLTIRCLVAPYERDPVSRRNATWHDRSAQARSWRSIRTAGLESDDDTVLVQSYRDYFNDHRLHTDAKMLGPDGQRCHTWTRGLLQPAHITATRLVRIGKESNLLEEIAAGLIGDQSEALTEYRDTRSDPFDRLVRPILAQLPIGSTARETGLDDTTVKRIRSGHVTPSAHSRTLLTKYASSYARDQLAHNPLARTGRDDLAACAAYLATHPAPACPICGTPPTRPRAKYCSRACRDRAYRNRKPHPTTRPQSQPIPTR